MQVGLKVRVDSPPVVKVLELVFVGKCTNRAVKDQLVGGKSVKAVIATVDNCGRVQFHFITQNNGIILGKHILFFQFGTIYITAIYFTVEFDVIQNNRIVGCRIHIINLLCFFRLLCFSSRVGRCGFSN